MRFEVLGPLRAWHGDSRLNLGPLQQRVVLAVLLLHANRPLRRERLIEAVWGTAAPAYAVNLVQKYVSGLRRVLEPARPGRAPSLVLSWTDGSYRLGVPAGGLDLDMFDSEVSRARAARARADLPGAAEALHSAIRLWRAPAYDGLINPLVDAERNRLAERHISVMEERIEVDLALGNHHDLIAELRQLVADHPLRERLHGLLMLGLYRCGRQGEALAAFQAARQRVVDELGVEPTAEIQRLHQRILAGDPALAAPATGSPALSAATGTGAEPRRPMLTPAQLPRGIPCFTGRSDELARLQEKLDRDCDGTGGLVPVIVIAGIAGVGKSALALHWAHLIRERFPDGQLYVNLRGFDPAEPTLDPAVAIRGFLDAFAVPAQAVPVGLEAQAALYRSLLAGRRVLVVLDNARDTDQVRLLLPGAPGCLVVVTSRGQLPSLVAAEGAEPVTLGPLSDAVAYELLTRRLGASRLTAEPEAVKGIVAACAGLPLALTTAATRAVTCPDLPLADLADLADLVDLVDWLRQATTGGDS